MTFKLTLAVASGCILRLYLNLVTSLKIGTTADPRSTKIDRVGYVMSVAGAWSQGSLGRSEGRWGAEVKRCPVPSRYTNRGDVITEYTRAVYHVEISRTVLEHTGVKVLTVSMMSSPTISL